MDRIKMSRENRAKQFAPYDALKGLQEALRLKEYEHDKIKQGELSETDVKEISDKLSNLKNGDFVNLTYFDDGYNKTICGRVKLNLCEAYIKIEDKIIDFNSIIKIK